MTTSLLTPELVQLLIVMLQNPTLSPFLWVVALIAGLWVLSKFFRALAAFIKSMK
jgi:hypothetical protein